MGELVPRFVQRLRGPPHELVGKDSTTMASLQFLHWMNHHHTRWSDISFIIPMFFVTVSTSITVINFTALWKRF